MKGVEWAIAVSDHPQATAEDAERIVAEQLEVNRAHNQRFDDAVQGKASSKSRRLIL